jgi:hypothetical protein
VSPVRREEPHQLGECVVGGAPGPGRYRGPVGAAETTPPIVPVSTISDRGGRQQIYVMAANGGEAQRISFGEGAYSTPVWSPRGDYYID